MGETHPGVVTTIGYNALPDFEYSDEPHEYLFQRLSSIVARGELALVQALQSPELQWALMAVYPHNPLLRERDYPAKDRTAKYQPVSRNLSRVYTQEQTPTMDAVRMAHDAHESVVQWYSFFNSGPTGFLEPGGSETVNDWRRIADHLHASPSKLLERFSRLQDQKYTSQKLNSSQRRELIQQQMAMLPFALMTVAWRAYPGESNAEKLKSFAEHFGVSDDQARMAQIPFASDAARQAFSRAGMLIGRMNTPQASMDYQGFANKLVEHTMATRMLDSLFYAKAFITTDAQLYDVASNYASEIGQQLGVDVDVLRSALDTFQSRFREAVSKDQMRGAGAGGKPGTDKLELRKLLQSIIKERTWFLIELQCELQSQALMDRVLNELFRPDEFNEVVALAHEKPLAELATRVEEVEELLQMWEVEFVIAPSHVGALGPREPGLPKVAPPKPPAYAEKFETEDMRIDEERYEWLKYYGQMWGRGAIVRSKIPNLPKHRQYRLVLLPEELPNGETIWHGIADNRDVGKHSLLYWRAEAGLDRYGRIRRTWDRVFKLYKDEMYDCGVYFLRHTPTLRDRVIELMYMHPDRIPRYEEYGEFVVRQVVEV